MHRGTGILIRTGYSLSSRSHLCHPANPVLLFLSPGSCALALLGDTPHRPPLPKPDSPKAEEAAHILLPLASAGAGKALSAPEIPGLRREGRTGQGLAHDRRSGQDVVPEPTYQVAVRQSAGARAGWGAGWARPAWLTPGLPPAQAPDGGGARGRAAPRRPPAAAPATGRAPAAAAATAAPGPALPAQLVALRPAEPAALGRGQQSGFRVRARLCRVNHTCLLGRALFPDRGATRRHRAQGCGTRGRRAHGPAAAGHVRSTGREAIVEAAFATGRFLACGAWVRAELRHGLSRHFSQLLLTPRREPEAREGGTCRTVANEVWGKGRAGQWELLSGGTPAEPARGREVELAAGESGEASGSEGRAGRAPTGSTPQHRRRQRSQSRRCRSAGSFCHEPEAEGCPHWAFHPSTVKISAKDFFLTSSPLLSCVSSSRVASCHLSFIMSVGRR